MDQPVDPHSRSRPDQIAVRHLSLDLTVDFDERRLSGSATLDLDRRAPDSEALVLDTWQLEIDNVTTEDGTELPYELGEHDPALGQALTVRVGTADRVVVHYATGSGARALQWLEPAQTASGRAVPVQPGPADPGAHLDPLPGQPCGADDLRRHAAGPAGPAGR